MLFPAEPARCAVHLQGIGGRNNEERAGQVFFFEGFLEVQDLSRCGKLAQFGCQRGAYDRHVGPGLEKRQGLSFGPPASADDHTGPFAQIQVNGIVFHRVRSLLMRDPAVSLMEGYFRASVSSASSALARSPVSLYARPM